MPGLVRLRVSTVLRWAMAMVFTDAVVIGRRPDGRIVLGSTVGRFEEIDELLRAAQQDLEGGGWPCDPDRLEAVRHSHVYCGKSHALSA
jgi:hypothetical protein